ncbi:type II toxin-antitoxin system RelE/ParE family toxin [Oleomonas cavernae]|uniref:Type II toxin-antitoxin system RelE/ParE family toxin n=1 Tax=Oleomonas cavernae TaxID=2320859 RepID=A0A418WAH8_9PROT|nr:type II toxin-antitoxin system RelE/ParE family toxin [Oleomonas cavernae]
MEVVWLPRANGNLVRIRSYISDFNPAAADRMATRILQVVKLIAEHPLVGRLGGVGDARCLPVPGTPYLIYYRIRGQHVEIIRIRHGMQQRLQP